RAIDTPDIPDASRLAAQPIVSSGSTHGVLLVSRTPTAKEFTSNDMTVLDAFANFIAGHLDQLASYLSGLALLKQTMVEAGRQSMTQARITFRRGALVAVSQESRVHFAPDLPAWLWRARLALVAFIVACAVLAVSITIPNRISVPAVVRVSAH